MREYLRWYLWFMKESYSFMAPMSKLRVTLTGIVRGHRFAKSMCQWDKMTPLQRENWYLSGEGRTFEF